MPDEVKEEQIMEEQDATALTDNGGEKPTAGSNAGTKLLTQEEVERILKERLERERKKYADYPTLKKKAEEYEAKLEELEKMLLERETELESVRLEAKKRDAVLRAGLPLELADRVLGTTDEEIAQDVERLKQLFSANKSIGIPTNPATPAGAQIEITRETIEKMTPDEIIKHWDVIQEKLRKGEL